MQIHGNARLLPRQRALMCERVRFEGWTVTEAAEAFGVSTRTVFRWLCRFDAGEAMTDRSSAPHKVPGRTSAQTEALIEQLGRLPDHKTASIVLSRRGKLVTLSYTIK